MVGLALPGDIVCRSVRDAGSYDRQTQRDINSGKSGQQLERDVSLVMIHCDDAVELAALRLHEQRVAGQRTGDVNPGLFGLFDGGLEDFYLLSAKEAPIAGVRIERCNG